MKRKLWHLFWELGVSIQAGLDDGDMAGHLNAWWDVARGRITRETRWGTIEEDFFNPYLLTGAELERTEAMRYAQ